MTNQEAEAFAARLKRIWGCCAETDVDWRLGGDGFSGYLPIQNQVKLFIYPVFWALKKGGTMGVLVDSLVFGFGTARVHATGKDESFTLFADQWLPFFRRGCWLSGCPIEASAHEKAEWIQGFTREEIEAWNLKL